MRIGQFRMHFLWWLKDFENSYFTEKEIIGSVHNSGLTDKIEAEFNGDKAKLFWPVNLDSKKKKSETYNILGIIDAPEDNS